MLFDKLNIPRHYHIYIYVCVCIYMYVCVYMYMYFQTYVPTFFYILLGPQRKTEVWDVIIPFSEMKLV